MANTIDKNIPESYLSLRQPSVEHDEKFISGINSSYEAAKLRSASKNKGDTFHNPVKFSWNAFWKTFIYENLPPVFVSPIAALILESTPNRAWHVIQNRGLCATSTKHHSLAFIIGSWLVTYPSSWLLTAALLLALFTDKALIQNIDTFQIILAYLLLFVRRLIISVKYAYFREEDLERICLPAPDWDDQKTQRRLIGPGWSKPTDNPGLIEDELTCAMDENDICLQGIPMELNDVNCKDVLDEESSPLFPSKTSASKDNEIASGSFLFNIIMSVYKKDFVKKYRLILYPSMLLIPATPFLVRYIYGASLFGVTGLEIIISVASILGFLLGFQLLFFGLVCSIDFERRYETAKKIGDLVKYPGLKFSELFTDSEDTNKEPIYLDLQKRVNVFAWMNMRKVLRSFGEAFYLRIEGYTSILIFYSLFCVGLLNLMIWTEMRHHISTIFVIVAIIAIISGISLLAMYMAIRLQSLSAEHRDFVRNELFIIEEEIWELKLANVSPERITDLESAKALLQQVDESINYKELIYKPTTIVGIAANNGVIGSILGLIITGCLLAVQGFVTTGIEYNAIGWFKF
jgi:hypothetical protein